MFIVSQKKNDMNIKEVSTLTGLSADMIRFYEKKRLVSPKRKSNGYRDFSIQDVHRLILIKQYNSLGIPLSTILDMLLGTHSSVIKEHVDKMVDHLYQESQNIFMRYVNALTLQSALQTNNSDQKWTIADRPASWYFRNDGIQDETYRKLFQYVTEGIGIPVFHISEESLHKSTYPHDAGILFPYHKPVDLPGGVRINARTVFQYVAQVPNHSVISMEQIHSIIQTAQKHGYHLCGNVWIYQLLSDTCHSDLDTVVLEFGMQETSSEL